MPIKTYVLPDGTKMEEDDPHVPIYYKGIINQEKGIVHGSWKIKWGIEIIKGRLMICPGNKGTWEMRKA